MRNTSRLIRGFFMYLFLFVMVLISVFPVLYILLASFKTNLEIMVGGTNLFPKVWQISNYIEAWKQADFSLYTFNSIYMCFFVVVGCIITATVEGYIFSRGTTLFSKFAYKMVTVSMFISLGALALYPQLGLAKIFGLNGTLWGPIIINVFGLNVTQVLLSTTYLKQIPLEIDEAAKIDGCSFFRTFVSIIFPLIKPLIGTIGLVAFRIAWSDYLLPYVFTISAPEKMTLVVGIVMLKNGGATASAMNLMMAGISISLIPMLIVYFILNKFFVAGITEGAIKG